jgi:hypothetical protein
MIYSVTVQVFGQISIHRFEAESEHEARQKALDRVGVELRVEIVTPIDAQ